MTRNALFLDLDNTIYPAPSISDAVFAPLFARLEEEPSLPAPFAAIRDALMRKPFQVVAREFAFSPALTEAGVRLLQEARYDGPIRAFDDFALVLELPLAKYLVTTGFPKLQESKLRGLALGNAFEEIHIVDPSASDRTKKDVFADILQRRGYRREEVLVLGDDPHSEIRAAQELGLDAVLYDKEGRYPDAPGIARISDYSELAAYL